MRVFQLHLILAFPSEFRSSLGVPANLHDRDTALFRLLDLTVHDLYRFFHEVEALVDLDLVEWTFESPNGKVRFQDRDAKGKMYVNTLAE